MSNQKYIKIPALIDIHVHIREPGDEHKETYDTGMRAAYESGISTICLMPNTKPSLIDEYTFLKVNNIAKRFSKKHKVKYFLYQAATHPPKPILDHKEICGIKMYLNCTTGDLKIDNPKTIEHYFKIDETKKRPIMCHAEIDILPTILELSKKYGQRTHICHVARKSEMELIIEAKKTNPLLTCEVAPHHLLLTAVNDDDPNYNFYNVKPNLQQKEDVEFLWENLDHVDCIATDHAPHTTEEKNKPNCLGFPGMETLLPLMLEQVRQGRLTLGRLIDLTHFGPLKVLGLDESFDSKSSIMIKNPLCSLTYPSECYKNLYSKCKWNPFNKRGVYAINDPVIDNEIVL